MGHHLQVAGDESWIQYRDAEDNRTAIAGPILAVGTNPKGSHWKKVPVPACGDPSGGGGWDPTAHRRRSLNLPCQAFMGMGAPHVSTALAMAKHQHCARLRSTSIGLINSNSTSLTKSKC